MEKLLKLTGRWNIQNKSDIWEGLAILTDDGWFEGIAVDPNSFYKGDRLIFGCYLQSKRVELLKLTPMNVSHPLVFRVWGKENNKYEGTINVAGILSENEIGTVTIIIEELPETDMTDLKTKLQLLKDTMDDNSKSFYYNTITMKEIIIDAVAADV